MLNFINNALPTPLGLVAKHLTCNGCCLFKYRADNSFLQILGKSPKNNKILASAHKIFEKKKNNKIPTIYAGFNSKFLRLK